MGGRSLHHSSPEKTPKESRQMKWPYPTLPASDSIDISGWWPSLPLTTHEVVGVQGLDHTNVLRAGLICGADCARLKIKQAYSGGLTCAVDFFCKVRLGDDSCDERGDEQRDYHDQIFNELDKLAGRLCFP